MARATGRRRHALLFLACLAVAAACASQPSPTRSSPAATGTAPRSAPSSTNPAGSEPAPAESWPTYHRDAARTGRAPGEPAFANLGRLWRTELDGQVYAEPLVSGQQVLAATEQNTVYALDAATGTVRWSTNLGPPMLESALPCGNIDPSGITGTPVIDLASGRLWVVAFVMPGIHQLVSLDLASGAVQSRQDIDLPGVDALAEQQRGALALVGGKVFVPFGGLFGDCGDYRGFVVSFPTSGPATQATFGVPTAREGAIWAPPGPVATPGGTLLVATGNGASLTTYDDGSSVIALSSDLHVLDTFAPANWQSLNRADLDLGSVSPALVGHDVFQIGKEGVGYLLDADHLGGIGGQRYSAKVCAGPAFGATAVDGTLVLVPCRDGLKALRVGPDQRFTVAWSQPGVATSAPVVAAGRVWAVTQSGELAEVDEQDGTVVRTEAVGPGDTSFPSLAIAGGRIFAQGGNAVVAFGNR